MSPGALEWSCAGVPHILAEVNLLPEAFHLHPNHTIVNEIENSSNFRHVSHDHDDSLCGIQVKTASVKGIEN